MPSGVGYRATIGHTTRAAMRDVGHRATIGYVTRAAMRDVGQRAMKTGTIRIKYNKNTLRQQRRSR